MPRYVVERDFGEVSDEEMQAFVARTKVLEAEQFADITWEGSRVCDDTRGGLKSFCLYTAPSAQRLHDHAGSIGGRITHRVFEVVGELDPDRIAV